MSGRNDLSGAEAAHGPAERRIDRLVGAQVHVTVLAVAAGLMMVITARRFTRVPGTNDSWALVLVVSGVLSLAAGLAPWISSWVTVRLQRLMLWSAIGVGCVGVLGAVWTVELWALLGLQSMVAAGALAELGTQRRAILHFWIATILVVGSVWLYHVLVSVQPRIG